MGIINDDILKLQEKTIKKLYFKLYNDIKIYVNKYFNDNIGFNEELYLYNNELIEKPKCKICSNNVRFISLYKGYVNFCSNKCSGEHKRNLSKEEKDIINNKRRLTTLEKYGVDNVSKSDKIQDKIKSTNIQKYGTYFPLFNEEIKKKKENTNLKNWGGNPLLNEELNIKRHETRKITMNDRWLDTIEEFVNKEKYNIKNYDLVNRSISIECIICGKIHDYTYYFIKQRIISKNILCVNCNPLYTVSEIKKENRRDKIKEKYNNLNLKDIKIISYNNGEFDCVHNSMNHNFIIGRKHLYDRIDGNISLCTICYPISDQKSIKELEVINWLKEYDNIKIIESDSTILKPKHLDIYLPQYNLGIEFNGLYLHSEIHKDKKYHLNKSIECLNKGIHLIHIWEDEWVFKQNIIKSIIKNKLCLITNKIYARNCQIRNVDPKTAKNFLDNNHIQGFCGSSVKLGLYYNNELVSLMTFGIRYINSNKELELLRFCNKIDTNVIGSASKLFKNFIKNNDFNKIVSYSDFRMFDGKLYKNLEFEKIHLSEPNYYWCKNMIRYHRYTFNKQKLIKDGFDPLKTEDEIMYERKYFKLYSCGQVRWVYNKKGC